jgi:hypothetical protein
VLIAGCIPAIFADGWVLPYNRDVVDWTKIAVLLPQRRVGETVAILRNITMETRCQMRKGILDFYNDYAKDSHGRLRVILKLVDARVNQSSASTTAFSAVPDRR